jgi:magnesium transporter
MYGRLLAPDIEQLIAARDFATIREVILDFAPVELADLVSELKEESRVVVFRLLPKDLAAETFSYCEFDTQQELLHDMAREEVGALLNDMSPDDRTQLFEDLPGNVVSELINSLNAEERSIALALLNWPEDSVGRLMTPDYVIVKKNWTVQQALDHIRHYGKDSETLNYLYVTEHGTLIDDLHIRELLLADPQRKISEIQNHSLPRPIWKRQSLILSDSIGSPCPLLTLTINSSASSPLTTCSTLLKSRPQRRCKSSVLFRPSMTPTLTLVCSSL